MDAKTARRRPICWQLLTRAAERRPPLTRVQNRETTAHTCDWDKPYISAGGESLGNRPNLLADRNFPAARPSSVSGFFSLGTTSWASQIANISVYFFVGLSQYFPDLIKVKESVACYWFLIFIPLQINLLGYNISVFILQQFQNLHARNIFWVLH